MKLFKKSLLSAIISVAVSPVVIANPTGGSFSYGSGTIGFDAGTSTTTVDASASSGFNGNTVIDWASFNIANGSTVDFLATNSRSIIANIDNSGVASNLSGALNSSAGGAQGATILVINPAGVNVGSTFVANVGALGLMAAGKTDGMLQSGSDTHLGLNNITLEGNDVVYLETSAVGGSVSVDSGASINSSFNTDVGALEISAESGNTMGMSYFGNTHQGVIYQANLQSASKPTLTGDITQADVGGVRGIAIEADNISGMNVNTANDIVISQAGSTAFTMDISSSNLTADTVIFDGQGSMGNKNISADLLVIDANNLAIENTYNAELSNSTVMLDTVIVNGGLTLTDTDLTVSHITGDTDAGLVNMSGGSITAPADLMIDTIDGFEADNVAVDVAGDATINTVSGAGFYGATTINVGGDLVMSTGTDIFVGGGATVNAESVDLSSATLYLGRDDTSDDGLTTTFNVGTVDGFNATGSGVDMGNYVVNEPAPAPVEPAPVEPAPAPAVIVEDYVDVPTYLYIDKPAQIASSSTVHHESENAFEAEED